MDTHAKVHALTKTNSILFMIDDSANYQMTYEIA